MVGAGYTEILSPECTPVRSICSMIPGIRISVTIAYGIYLNLFTQQIFINQNWMILCDTVDDSDKFINIVIIDRNLHSLSAKYVRRTNQYRITQSVCNFFASSAVNTVPPVGLGISHCSRISSKSSRSSAASTSSADVPRIGTPIFISASVSLIAVCPPN